MANIRVGGRLGTLLAVYGGGGASGGVLPGWSCYLKSGRCSSR
jgi:hypothetical protein